MAFAFMNIGKIKTMGEMTAKYNHNCRKVDIDNVMPELSHLNDEIVPLPKASNKTLSYTEAFEQRIGELDYYRNHDIRTNAVLGYEVLLTYSRADNVDVTEWKKENLKWLEDTFNESPDKKSNILHAIYHADETGNGHIHALVIPIDEKGKLNSSFYTPDARAMTKLQNDYADRMKKFGLERGTVRSTARHQDIRRMYAKLDNVITAASRRKNETLEHYINRIEELKKNEIAALYRRAIDYDHELRRKRDVDCNKQIDLIHNHFEQREKQFDKHLQKSKKELHDIKTKAEKAKTDLEIYNAQLAELHEQWMRTVEQMQRMEEEKEQAAMYRKLMRGVEVIKEEDPLLHDKLQNGIDYALSAADRYQCEEKDYVYPDLDPYLDRGDL